MHSPPENNFPRWQFIAMIVALVTGIVFIRSQVLQKFGFVYTDSDQAIMWSAAVDFSKGIFHEPKFYGQNYNSMLEGLLAAPLLLLDFPAHKALPFTTTLMALFPFFMVAGVCISKDLKPQAILVLCLPLLLPVEYDFLTTMPRAFVPGIFVASLGWVAVFYNDRTWAFLAFGFFTVTGYLLGQNSLLLSLPLGFYLWLENKKRISFYISAGIGLIAGGILLFLSNNFYVTHPTYDSRPVPDFGFSFELLKKTLTNLDELLNPVSPIFWQTGFLVLILLLLLIYTFYEKRQDRPMYALLLFLFCLISTFGLTKLQNGTNSIFFSSTRMLLSVPLAFAFFIPFLNLRSKWVPVTFFVLALSLLIIKFKILPEKIDEHVDYRKDHIVAMDKYAVVVRECRKLNYFAQKNKTNLVVIAESGFYDFYDFGCAVCLDSFPNTLRPDTERRTWRLIEDKDRVYPNVMIIDEYLHKAGNLQKLIGKNIHYEKVNGIYLLSGNTLKTMELFKLLEIPVRNF